jgi:Protein of unknown function (DUF5663)
LAERLGRFGEQEAAPRDQAIGALVWLHLANGSASERELTRAATDAEDFLWEAASGDALYGLPQWIAATPCPDAAESEELREALQDIESSIRERQRPAPEHLGGRPELGEEEVLELLKGIDPKGRDEAWRSVRSEVPIVMRTREGEAAGLLLGLYVDVGDPSQEKEVLAIGPQTMAKDFLGGIEDGHRAALALLDELGLDGVMLWKLRHIVVSGLGLREPPDEEDPPLRGRSAGLPVALTLLKRASELDGNPLPPMPNAATGSIRPDGRLESMDVDAKELKLAAVRADGWFQEMLCPPSTEGETPHAELSGTYSVADLKAAANSMWGPSWTDWSESLRQRSAPRKSLLEAIWRSLNNRQVLKPSKAIEPDRVLREVVHGKSTRSVSDATGEAREAMGSRASAEAATTASQPSRPPPTRFPAEIDNWESWEALSRQARGGGDVEAESQKERRAARERVWDPFGEDERHALLTGGSSEDRARLLERHIDTWLQEAYRAGAVKVPLLVEAPRLGAELGSRGDSENLARALAALLGIDPRRPSGEYLQRALEQGRMVLGLEGWELLDEDAIGALKAALSRFVERGNNLVVTCQASEAASIGVIFPRTHTHNRLQGLSSDQVRTHVLAELDVRADAFLALMERDPRLAELARTPALLQLLCRAVNHLGHPTQMTCARLLEVALRFALPEDGRDLRPFAAAIAAVSGADEMPARISRERLREALLEQRCSGEARLGEDPCEGLIRNLVNSAVLIEEQDVDGADALRFGHPALQTASVAIHLAGLPAGERWSKLKIDERLRPERELLIELCCGIAGNPAEIIERLLDDPVDPWAVKLVRAANCLREAGRVPSETAALVVSRLTEALADSRPLPEKRYLAEALASLVEAGISGAAEAAGGAIDDTKLQHPVVTRLAVSLNRTGDRRGLARLMDMAQGPSIGPAAAAFDALGEQDSSNALQLLEGMLVSRRCDQRLLLRTSALEGADEDGLIRLADLLRESMVTIPVRQALATAIASIPAAQGIAFAAASDRRVPWSVRAAAATRLAMDFPLPPSLGGLVQSPNLTWQWRARLLTAMIKSGDSEALDEVATVLSLPLGSTDRSALIEAVAAARGGRRHLLTHVEKNDSDWTRHTEILVALVGSGDRTAIDTARELVAGDRLGESTRTRVIQALAGRNERAWIAPALELVNDSAVSWDHRIDLAISLAEAGELKQDMLRALLALAEEQTSLDGRAELIRAYWAAHETCAPIAEMVGDERLVPGLRAEIASAYCWAAKSASEMPIPDSIVALLRCDGLDRWHLGLLATSLARSGRPEHRVAALEASLDAGLLELRVYRGLVRDMMLDPVSLPLGEELGERLYASLATPASEEQMSLDSEARQELETRVGARVALCSPIEDTRVFERHVDEGDEALSFEILDRMVPYYQAIVRDEYALLRAEQEGEEPVADGAPDRGSDSGELHPLDVERFKAWSRLLTPQAESKEISQAFIAGLGPVSTELEVWLESGELEWPEEPAHRFLLGRVRREGIENSYRSALESNFLQRALRNRLEVGDGRGLLDAAGMLALLSQTDGEGEANSSEAPVFFYASIGAAIHGSSGLAIELIERCAWLLSKLDAAELKTTMAVEGIATIGEVETLHGLDDNACMQALRSRLHELSD